jgi:hypothetical protein
MQGRSAVLVVLSASHRPRADLIHEIDICPSL